MSIAAVLALTASAVGQNVIGWGQSDDGAIPAPADAGQVIALSAGNAHVLALRLDGTVRAWGSNGSGQTTVPVGLSNVVEISTGLYHSMARRADGVVVAWGGGDESVVPSDLGAAVSISAGSFYSVAARTNGTVRAWGRNDYGQSTPPTNLGAVTRVAAGESHGLALSFGTVTGWGRNTSGQASPPANLTTAVEIDAGRYFSVARTSAGSVVCWGDNSYGVCSVPASATDVTDISAGSYHMVALKADGSLVTWGYSFNGLLSPPPGLSSIVDVAAGSGYSLVAVDLCTADPLKVVPGACGCGVPETGDTDGDGAADCNDTDDDNDGVPDASDGCPLDPLKAAPGTCGCGIPEVDSDGDGTPNCVDADDDNDGVPDSTDGCPFDPFKSAAGVCGCGVPDADSDGDGTKDCLDGCPNDPLKTIPQQCGCGVPEGADRDGDGARDCVDQAIVGPLELLASDGAAGDRFGAGVALIHGDIIIGAARADIAGRVDQGAAYVFRKQPSGGWQQVQKLVASMGAAGDTFGFSIDASGDFAVISSEGSDVNGLSNAGAAYVFERQPDGVWTERARLTAADARADDAFGGSVAIDGSRIAVGAIDATVNGTRSGAVYVFTRTATGAWIQEAQLAPLEAGTYEFFGISVDISGDYIIGASNRDEVGAIPDAGSATVFRRDGAGSWVQDGRFEVPNLRLGDYGNDVSIDGTTAFFGSAWGDVGTSAQQGYGWIYERDAVLGWVPRQKITGSDSVADDYFGAPSALVGDTLLVGAPSDTTGGSGGVDAGSAYLYRRIGNSWQQLVKFRRPLVANSDSFGNALAVASDTVVIGARFVDLAGVADRGAVYVFDLDCDDDGAPDTNFDGDTLLDCEDPDDDNDGVFDGDDGCPFDALKSAPGLCGCGVSDTDTDGDTVPNCVDPDDDNDGILDEVDLCPLDPANADADGDGQLDCLDPDDDNDGTPDATDGCPFDALKTTPGQCGCGTPEGGDADGDGVRDCVDGIVGYVQRVHAPMPAVGRYFGLSIDAEGDLLAVGAPGGLGLGATNLGRVYLYRLGIDGRLVAEGELAPTASAAGDLFGLSVDMVGGRLFVGAPGAQAGVHAGAGVVYLFERNAQGSWEQAAVLQSNAPTASALFGWSVASDGVRVAVGAIGAGSSAGAVEVFALAGDNTFEHQSTLLHPGASSLDQFGAAVAIEGNLVAALAPGDDFPPNTNRGSAWVSELEGSVWSTPSELKPMTNEGTVLRVSGNLTIRDQSIFVGMYQVSSWGRVEQFAKLNGAWESVRRVRPNLGAFDAFGYNFAFDGDAYIVGAPLGTNGGAIYRMAPDSNGGFVQTHRAFAPGGAANDYLGYDTAVIGNRIIASAPEDDIPNFSNVGSISVFDFTCTTDSDLDGDADCTDADDDGDGVPDDFDACPFDPTKSVAGTCGCGVAELDTDGDGVADCLDGDDDGDGVPDLSDGCPRDAAKLAPGVCGCGVADVDTDGDGAADCVDLDDDGDGTPDASDGCPTDATKIVPGVCGCGNIEGADSDADGVGDCIDGRLPATSKLLAFNGAASDRFGTRVAVDGTFLVTGAPQRVASGLTGAGAAYFQRQLSDGSWISEGMVIDGTPSTNANFGAAVAISGGFAAIGSPFDLVSGTASGTVHVYKRTSSGTWALEATMQAPSPSLNMEFGGAVALDGDLLVVGGRRTDTTDAVDTGAAWIFRRVVDGSSQVNWVLEATLQPANLKQSDRFGSAVALKNGLLAVGAPDREVGTVQDAGAIFIYRRSTAGVWQSEGIVRAATPATTGRFGAILAIDGGTIVAGEPSFDLPVSNIGRVSVVGRSMSGLWNVTSVLQPALAEVDAGFGTAVAINDGVLVVGAPASAAGATPRAGHVHVFQMEGAAAGETTRWTSVVVGHDPLGVPGDGFGSSVAVGSGVEAKCVLSSSPTDDELGLADRGSVSVFTLSVADCNENSVLDILETASGAGDCDGNGVPDTCEGIESVSYVSSDVGPIGSTTPVQLVVPVTARATSDVTLQLRASANLAGTSRFLLVSLDGGASTVVFNGNEGDCASPANTTSIVVPKATWNTAALDGSIIVRFTASPTVSSAACGGGSYVGCSYAYTGLRVSADCNANGVLDRCEGGAGYVDCNRNGLADSCEIASGDTPDVNGNGVPDACEMVVRVGSAGGYPTIEDALAAAMDGWIIEVEAGVYGPIDTRGRSLVIRGVGEPGTVVIDAAGAAEAIRVRAASHGGIVSIEGVVARGASGRGVAVLGGTALLENVRITANAGGGLEAYETATVLVHQSRFDTNAATQGAGVFVRAGATVVLGSTRVEGNLATDRGGGVHVLGDCVIESCAFEANGAVNGGSAISLAGTPASIEISESDFCRHASPIFLGSWIDLGGNRVASDCNANGVCDLTEIDAGAADIDGDFTLDSCESDCDDDSIPDDFEIATGAENDVDLNGVPDRCQPDCDSDGLPDTYEIAQGASDIDANGVPDACQPDCDGDGRPDAWELATGADRDCNSNQVIDSCDIAAGTALDCNTNGVPDTCDLAAGTSTDLNGSGRPDECEFVVGGSGYATPQAAIQAAPNAAIVEIAAGTYGPISIVGKSITLRALGAAGSVVIDGAAAIRVLEIRNQAVVTLERLVFRNGRAAQGAGLLVADSLVQCTDCVFENNIATGSGGAVYAVDSVFEALHCVLHSNGALDGGAISLQGASPSASRIVDCVLRLNTTSDRGGAITTSLGLEILRSIVESSLAGPLGAALDVVGVGTNVTLRDSRFCLNQPLNIQGRYTDLGGNILSTDCDSDGICDADEIAAGSESDCNMNGVPDDCDVASGASADCNTNGIPDSCDIASGFSDDIEPNGVPDECKPDCDADGLPDAWEISQGFEIDCDRNGVPDPCDIALGAPDCDDDGRIDGCEITSGDDRDCDASGVLDRCEIADGASDDDGDGELDRCNFARGDFDLDDDVGAADLSFLLVLWGTVGPPIGDLDGDGSVGAGDLSLLLANWGRVP
jgi:predicted outer membrane repeat protein